MDRYATVGQFKEWIGITDATDDVVIGAVLDTVSRWIDLYCGRFFYQTSAEIRYFTPVRTDRVQLPDVVSVSAVATDEDGDRTYETTWAVTDYDLTPDNAAAAGEPYDAIEVAPSGMYGFPLVRKGLKITGVWGWPLTPEPVREACLLQGARVFKRRDSPQGVMGSADLGFVRVSYRLDPDVQQWLDPFRRPVVA